MARPRRHRAALAAVLCAAAGCAPAAASGPTGTGGAQIPVQIAPSVGPAGYGAPGTRSILADPTALAGKLLHVRGTFPGKARRRAVLQRLDARRGWRDVARTRVHSSTRFDVRWRPTRTGRTSLRVVLARRAAVAAAAAAPVATVNVYRPAMATFFGPGLYGRATYCGQTLTQELLGVAHRWMACGTQVSIVFERREITVPVIDRGPFSEPFDWDLTQGTADALGFTGSGEIGYALFPAARVSG